MKRLFLSLIVVLAFAAPAHAAIARTCNRQDGAFINGGTTGTFNSVGASLITIALSYNEGFPPTITSTPTLTWVLLTDPGSATGVARIAYALNTSPSGTHTVTLTGSSTYAGVEVACWSGTATTAVLETDTTARADNVITLATGSVTPALNGALILTALGHGTAGATPTIDAGFTVSDRTDFIGGDNYGSALAYLIQTTAGPAAPTWTWTGAVSSPSAAIAVFKAAVAAPTTITLVTSAKALNSGSSTTATTATIDTTGATHLYCACSQYLGGGTSADAVCTDSKNPPGDWVLINEKPDDTAFGKLRVFHIPSNTPIVGTGHTFTCAGTATYPLTLAAAFAGTAASPLDQQIVSQGGLTSQASGGGIAPIQNGEVIITSLSFGDVTSGFSVSDSMTIAQSEPFVSGQMGGVLAYKIQTTATAINPTISWSGGSTPIVEISTASIKALNGTGGPASPTGLLLLGVR